MPLVTPAQNLQLVLAAITPSTTFATPTYSSSIAVGQCNQSAAYINFTKGSLTSCTVVMQGSYDNTTWFNKPLLNFSTAALDVNGVYAIPMAPSGVIMTASQSSILDLPTCYSWIRFKIYGIGTATGSSISIYVGSGAV